MLGIEILLALESVAAFHASLVNKNAKATVSVVAAIKLISAWSTWAVVGSTLVAFNNHKVCAVVCVDVGRVGLSDLVRGAGKACYFAEGKRSRVAGAGSVIDAAGAGCIVTSTVRVVVPSVGIPAVAVVGVITAASVGVAITCIGIGVAITITCIGIGIGVGCSGIRIGVDGFSFILNVFDLTLDML